MLGGLDALRQRAQGGVATRWWRQSPVAAGRRWPPIPHVNEPRQGGARCVLTTGTARLLLVSEQPGHVLTCSCVQGLNPSKWPIATQARSRMVELAGVPGGDAAATATARSGRLAAAGDAEAGAAAAGVGSGGGGGKRLTRLESAPRNASKRYLLSNQLMDPTGELHTTGLLACCRRQRQRPRRHGTLKPLHAAPSPLLPCSTHLAALAIVAQATGRRWRGSSSRSLRCPSC